MHFEIQERELSFGFGRGVDILERSFRLVRFVFLSIEGKCRQLEQMRLLPLAVEAFLR
jgi:hypothetical protein